MKKRIVEQTCVCVLYVAWCVYLCLCVCVYLCSTLRPFQFCWSSPLSSGTPHSETQKWWEASFIVLIPLPYKSPGVHLIREPRGCPWHSLSLLCLSPGFSWTQPLWPGLQILLAFLRCRVALIILRVKLACVFGTDHLIIT
jgi:hypothetical protein